MKKESAELKLKFDENLQKNFVHLENLGENSAFLYDINYERENFKPKTTFSEIKIVLL